MAAKPQMYQHISLGNAGNFGNVAMSLTNVTATISAVHSQQSGPISGRQQQAVGQSQTGQQQDGGQFQQFTYNGSSHLQQHTMGDNCLNSQANLIGFAQASPNQQNVQQHVPFNNMGIMSQQSPNIAVSSPRPIPPPPLPLDLPLPSRDVKSGTRGQVSPVKNMIFQNAADASPQNIHIEIQNANQQGSSSSMHRLKTSKTCLTYRTSFIR